VGGQSLTDTAPGDLLSISTSTRPYYSLDDHHVAALFREAEYHADHVRSNIPDHDYPLP
jgi:hypothetical protein